MSFMFKPYPFTDPAAINYPEVGKSLAASLVVGNRESAVKLLQAVPEHGVLLLDGYVGARFEPLLESLKGEGRVVFLEASRMYRSSAELEAMLAESLPLDRDIDPVLLFGKGVHRDLNNLLDANKITSLIAKIDCLRPAARAVVVYGSGAACPELRAVADCAAFLDVTPLQATLRVQERLVRPLGDDGVRSTSYIFRRLYYFDYEIMMLHRQELLDGGELDFYLDNNLPDRMQLLPVKSLMEVMDVLVRYPLRCTPVYLEGVWGGFLVKELRRLPEGMRNCAWVFDLIPNEVSLQVRLGKSVLQLPFSTFFKARSRELMGEASVNRFGRVFPIRFNYDDTYRGGGNMSIQVHPPQAYCNEHFGEPFQQDESYYVVKTAGSKTYLGLQDDCDVDEFYQCLDRAEKEHIPFDHDQYVNSFPSAAGDQYLLPGGTIHASGVNQVVLEIGSYTIGSYTFKLYDYLRKDLEGNPRPIHSIHGKNVLATERRRSNVDGVLRPKPVTVREGEGWLEEVVGEHDLIYFSLRRFSFDRSVSDDTKGEKFHVLVLVEGEEVLVCSKKNPNHFYHQRHMDMVVVPAAMGEYTILNLGSTPCKVTKTMLK